MNKISLSDVASVITKGTTPTTVGGNFLDKGIYFVKSESVGTAKKLDNNLFQFIDSETDEKLKRSRLQKDDLLFSIAGAYLGKISIVHEDDLPANTNQAVGIVRIDKTLADVDYLYYYFSQIHINKYINNLSSQSSQPNLNLSLLGGLRFENKTLDTQKAIASVLSSLDAKIELNNRINIELEAMAKTLYDYWFVQFNFPMSKEQAEAIGKPAAAGKPYKSSGGKMVYNKELKREIPEGWEVISLIDLCTNIGDGIHGTPQYIEESEYSFINGNNLKNGFIQFDYDTKKVSKAEYDKYFIDLNNNTILLSINGTLGNLAIFLGEKVMLGKSSAYINCKADYRDYCYQFLSRPDIQKTFWLVATGSTIKNLSLASLKSLKILSPKPEVLKKFNEMVNPITQKRINIFKQNQQLASLRDWLLPMLMNGQLSVRQARASAVKEAKEKLGNLNMTAEPESKYKTNGI